ncbi:MAG: DUF2851 family protein [Victivallales bacterium]|nr:DUF2851 family protein [Victivallales bacterium]
MLEWEIREKGLPCPFSEKFLQVIWNEGHIVPLACCVDGTPLRVLSPGVWNGGGGPDFQGAALLLGGIPVHGDVEIHRYASDWRRHGHDRDGRYDGVVLHVVWVDDYGSVLPDVRTLELHSALQPEWQKLLWRLEDACYPHASRIAPGDCALRWALTDDARVRTLLTTAGLARFSAKGDSLARLAADLGQEQALYVALFDCLGYQANREPFRALAETLPVTRLVELGNDLERTAALLGTAGMLPDLTREPVLPECQEWVRQLWDNWWRMGGGKAAGLEWHRAGLRPYNSPCRRLLAGIQWLRRAEYRPAAWLKGLAKRVSSPKELVRALESPGDGEEWWRGLLDFGHRISPPADLLGRERLLDLAANVLLPYLHAVLSRTPDAKAIADLAREAFCQLPLGQDNRLAREATLRFLTPPSRVRDVVRNICQQQGLLDLYTGFCLALNSDCRHCPFVAET